MKDLLKRRSADIFTDVKVEDLGQGKKRLHIIKTQDVAPILGANSILRNDNTLRRHRSDSEWLNQVEYADIPFTVLIEWRQKFKFDYLAGPAANGMTRADFQKKLRSLINHPDYSHCKTFNGRV